MIQLKETCLAACQIIKDVGSFILAQQQENIEIQIKGHNSLVSYVDQTAEQALVSRLSRLIEGAVFLTEEETIAQETGDWRWIIDPLDGTTNFLHGIPCYSVSVALQQMNQTVIGIVYEINHDELFYAWKDGGAFLNQKPIHVKATTSLADTLIATGFPYYDYSKTSNFLEVLELLMQKTRGVRRMGSAAVDLAYVAAGRFDAFFEYSLHPWDVAGGAFLVQEAGGWLGDFKGQDNYLFGKEMIACSKAIQPVFFPLIKNGFKE